MGIWFRSFKAMADLNGGGPRVREIPRGITVTATLGLKPIDRIEPCARLIKRHTAGEIIDGTERYRDAAAKGAKVSIGNLIRRVTDRTAFASIDHVDLEDAAIKMAAVLRHSAKQTVEHTDVNLDSVLEGVATSEDEIRLYDRDDTLRLTD